MYVHISMTDSQRHSAPTLGTMSTYVGARRYHWICKIGTTTTSVSQLSSPEGLPLTRIISGNLPPMQSRLSRQLAQIWKPEEACPNRGPMRRRPLVLSHRPGIRTYRKRGAPSARWERPQSSRGEFSFVPEDLRMTMLPVPLFDLWRPGRQRHLDGVDVPIAGPGQHCTLPWACMHARTYIFTNIFALVLLGSPRSMIDIADDKISTSILRLHAGRQVSGEEEEKEKRHRNNGSYEYEHSTRILTHFHHILIQVAYVRIYKVQPLHTFGQSNF